MEGEGFTELEPPIVLKKCILPEKFDLNGDKISNFYKLDSVSHSFKFREFVV